jgi:TolA-binding protein
MEIWSMRQNKKETNWQRRAWALALAALTCGSLAQAAYVELPTGKRIDGTEIRATATGDIILTTPQGRMTFTKGQYVHAVADKPAEIDQAAQLMQSKQYDEAIKKLEDVVTRYRFLEWDNQARVLLPKIYFEKGDFASAVSAYDKLFASSPKSREDADVMWSYRTTLLKAKAYDKLIQQLDEVIASGARGDAARAQIMRGDVQLAQGQLEPAALDYLRTMVLFKAESDYQAEAIFKAASVLEQLRDSRAKELYRQVVQEYPNSSFASAARGKL